jgi:hypothetical protein
MGGRRGGGSSDGPAMIVIQQLAESLVAQALLLPLAMKTFQGVKCGVVE